MAGFSSSSKLLQKYEQEKAMRLHKQKLGAAKTRLDTKSPKKYPHVVLRLKRIQQEEERQTEVDHENKLLLQKMAGILKNRPMVDNWNEYEPKSLNYGARERAYRDMHMENVGIARRLEKAQPVYKMTALEEEYQKKRYLQSLWAENAKDFVDVTPRHLRYRQLKRHKEGDDISEGDHDFESEANSLYRHKVINRDSLPPIENGNSKNIRYLKEDASDSPKFRGSKERLPKLDKKQSEDGSMANGGHTDRSDTGQKGDNSNPQRAQMDSDAKQLFNAAKLIGKVHPEDIIIRTLVRRSRKQRMQIKARFEEHYELTLIPELKAGLGSDWYMIIDALLDEKICSTARILHDALEEGSYGTTVETLCQCDPLALDELNDKYNKDYAVTLEGDIKDKTDPPEQTLLLALHKGRDESKKVNDKQAEKDADELYESGDGRWSSETGPFIKMVNTYNFAHVKAVLNYYRVLTGGKDAVDDVKAECSRQYAEAVITMLNLVKGSDMFYADKMFKMMSPKNQDFINMLVIHSEIDMPTIKRAYKKKYDAEIVDDIKHKCSDPIVNVLVELANKVPPGQGKKRKPSLMGQQPKRLPFKRPDQKPKNSELETKTKHNPLKQQSLRVAAETVNQRKHETVEKETVQLTNRRESKVEQTTNRESKGEQTGKKESKVDQSSEKEVGLSKSESPKKEMEQTKKESKPVKKEATKSKKNVSGTVKSYANFDADQDCDDLHEAMGGYGTDEGKIAHILAKRSNDQRQELKITYDRKFKKDLTKELQSELQGDFEEVILALMMTPVEYDVYCLHETMEGLGTTEATLIGVLVTKDAQEKQAIANQYMKEYKTDLDSVVRTETSGNFRDLIKAFAKSDRDQGTEVDTNRAQQDAKQLNKNGQISIDPADEVFIDLMVKRNHVQVRATFQEYEKLAGYDVYTGLTNAMLGDAEDGYIMLAKAVENPVEFYAERLESCFSGLGTNDNVLISIVVSRSEIDLGDIKSKFAGLYKKSLSQTVRQECKGDYKEILLAVIGDN